MTIANQILQLKENLNNSRRAVSIMGGTVGEIPAFDNLAAEIDSIPVGDANYAMVVDDGVAFRKNILPGALPNAKLVSVGGMTYKSKNLVDIPFIDATTSGGAEGVTISVNWSSPIYVSAEECATTSSSIWRFKIDYTDGTSTYVMDNHLRNGGIRITASESKAISAITYRNTYITDGKYSGIMISYGETRVPYEPYYEGLRDTKVTAIINRGANLLDISRTGNTSFIKVQNNGQTIEIRPLTSGTGNGYTGTERKMSELCPSIKIGDVIIYDFNSTGTNQFVFLRGPEQIWYPNSSLVVTQAILDATLVLYGLNLESGLSGNSYIYDFRINYGSTVAPFQPYRADIEIPLPEEITSLDEWGKGVDEYSNTYDFESGTYTKNCITLEFNGTENWKVNTSRSCTYVYQLPMRSIKGLCSVYNIVTASELGVKQGAFLQNSNQVNITDFDCSTLEDFKAKLANIEIPLVITYAVATPTTETVPIAFDNIINVEGGGSIEFVNEYNQSAPSDLRYMRRLS